jgi:hypothetical protein
MKNNILLALLFFLIPIIINGQTQEATTSDGKKVILNADGTWKYAEKDRGLGTQGNVSYDLGGRGSQSLPKPNYDYQGEGRVVVDVSVDRAGKVKQATPGTKGSTTLDEYLLKVAKEAALKARFDPKADAPVIQKGKITYIFQLR